MTTAQPISSLDEASPGPAAIFQQEWRIYRKMVEGDYLFHRAAYAALRRVLVEDAPRPFRFLDLACGDASASAEALAGTEIASYRGVDLSEEALKLAHASLDALRCPVSLCKGEFQAELASRRGPVDVVWIGLSLHHLRAPEKLAAMRAARRLMGDDGMLLLYENASPDGESRDGWLERWDKQEPDWTLLAPGEWRRMRAHVGTHDFPETVSTWRELARGAGFATVSEVFVAPTDLFRLFMSRPS
jgi:SAM-dependent methyltransferase